MLGVLSLERDLSKVHKVMCLMCDTLNLIYDISMGESWLVRTRETDQT